MTQEQERDNTKTREAEQKAGNNEEPSTSRKDRSQVLTDPPQGLRSEADAGMIAGESVETASAGTIPTTSPIKQKLEATGRSAFLVGAGILISRIIGVIRQRVFAYYFGKSLAADVFTAAFRIPNFLQNVFGEGALSASFIPVYAKLLARGDDKEADRVASAVLSLLALTASIIVFAGVLGTPYLISVVAMGFEGEGRELAIRLVRIFFPGAGLLVLSAWCLGVLNSHRRFFLSYTAPVIWNLAIIFSLVWFGGRSGNLAGFELGRFQFQLAELVAWGSVVGSALQFAVQLPTVLALVRHIRPVLETTSASVRTIIRNFFPVFISRGVVQISAFVDMVLATLLPEGAVAAVNYAQSLYTLPVSLFGMSVSAAELPAMSSAIGSDDEISAELRKRLNAGLRRIAFFIVPSSMAMLALGDVIVAALYQNGQFRHDATTYVWGILAGSTVGLLASTFGRLYSSTYYALHDTRTPLRFAVLRVTLTIVLGYLFALYLPPLLGLERKWGAAGLTISAGLAGWIEFALLRSNLNKRIGSTGLALNIVGRFWLSAAGGAAVGWGIRVLLGDRHPFIVALAVLIPYGLSYFALTMLFGLPEVPTMFARVLKLLPFRRR